MFNKAENLANVTDAEIAHAIHYIDAVRDDLDSDDRLSWDYVRSFILMSINQQREGAAIDEAMNAEPTYVDLMETNVVRFTDGTVGRI